VPVARQLREVLVLLRRVRGRLVAVGGAADERVRVVAVEHVAGVGGLLGYAAAVGDGEDLIIIGDTAHGGLLLGLVLQHAVAGVGVPGAV